MARATLLGFLLAIGPAGCEKNSTDERPRPATVRGTVDLPRTGAGPGAGGRVVTGHDATGFTGHVEPPDSTVTVVLEGGRAGPVILEPTGRFSAAVGGLHPGHNAVKLRAVRAGHRPWHMAIDVERRPRGPTVEVPRRDTTPPVALLQFAARAGGAEVLSVSPSAPDDRHAVVELSRPSFHATAVVRDDGGAARIRLSTTYRTRCPDREGPTHISFPPAQIENVRLAPGTRIAIEERRTMTLPLDAGPGCSVSGQAWAEATDGQGLQAVTRHVAFRYRPSR